MHAQAYMYQAQTLLDPAPPATPLTALPLPLPLTALSRRLPVSAQLLTDLAGTGTGWPVWAGGRHRHRYWHLPCLRCRYLLLWHDLIMASGLPLLLLILLLLLLLLPTLLLRCCYWRCCCHC